MFEKGSSLKDEVMGKPFFFHLATSAKSVFPDINEKAFLADCLKEFEPLSLMERMDQGARTLGTHLPSDYLSSISIIKKIAPKLEESFSGIILPAFIQLHGLDDFQASMDALKFLTPFSTSEFAVRPFVARYPKETFALFYEWSTDDNEHVRRWCSEGTRPRLPWGQKLDRCIQEPQLALPILEKLQADDSLYVRKSVANHLNDQSKDNAEWVLDVLASWDQSNTHTAWITKHALRSLIKDGHPRTFPFLGYEKSPQLFVSELNIQEKKLTLGNDQFFDFSITSKKDSIQKLVVDYKVYYAKANGKINAKTFKLKEITLQPKETLSITKKHAFKDFSTRKHYSGIHSIEIMIHGISYGKNSFELVV